MISKEEHIQRTTIPIMSASEVRRRAALSAGSSRSRSRRSEKNIPRLTARSTYTTEREREGETKRQSDDCGGLFFFERKVLRYIGP